MTLTVIETTSAEATTNYYPVHKWDAGQLSLQEDCVAEEVPVAMVYNGISHAVMLATPQDLEDFALGFSLTEGIISAPDDIYSIEIIIQPNGIELQIELSSASFQSLKQRRRNLAGRTGCGLCGAESLEQAMRSTDSNIIQMFERIPTQSIHAAYNQIHQYQKLQNRTGGTHASALVGMTGEIKIIREDVGRHNALDKLIGAMIKAEASRQGFIFTTSRASYEMVHKVATVAMPVLVAVSAPTGLAIKTAQRCGITLVAFARQQRHVVYSVPDRIMHKEK